MNILAIDPGYDKIGYAVFSSKYSSNIKLATSGLIKTQRDQDLVFRLKQIQQELSTIIKNHAIDCMVMEQLFFFKNAKTVIAVAQAQGSIIALASTYDLQFHFLTPLQIKQIVTGDGRADKASVWKMLKLQISADLKVGDDDESDAIACGYAFCLVAPQYKISI